MVAIYTLTIATNACISKKSITIIALNSTVSNYIYIRFICIEHGFHSVFISNEMTLVMDINNFLFEIECVFGLFASPFINYEQTLRLKIHCVYYHY